MRLSRFFFFNDPATTEIYTLSLHDALPIFAILGRAVAEKLFGSLGEAHIASSADKLTGLRNRSGFLMEASMRLRARSEEHTSELQSLAYLVCRLLLEKKKKKKKHN